MPNQRTRLPLLLAPNQPRPFTASFAHIAYGYACDRGEVSYPILRWSKIGSTIPANYSRLSPLITGSFFYSTLGENKMRDNHKLQSGKLRLDSNPRTASLMNTCEQKNLDMLTKCHFRY